VSGVSAPISDRESAARILRSAAPFWLLLAIVGYARAGGAEPARTFRVSERRRSIDVRVVLFLLAVAGADRIAFGLVPALQRRS
jgi:hypothetical protein